VDCPRCARHIQLGKTRCPHCGAVVGPRPILGSTILRPDPLPTIGAARGYQETALVDHDHAMRRLRTAWRAAHGGHGHLISLVGENGSGRSRLIRELSTTIDEEAPDGCWLIGQAHSYATYQPLHLLASLLTPWTEAGTEGDVRAQLTTALIALADGAPAQERWALLALAREVRDTEDRDALVALPLAEMVARALRRVVGSAPLILVLEDLEWADAASLLILDALLPQLLNGAALVVYTHHADWSHEWPEVARQSQLYLGALSQSDSRLLIRNVAVEPLDPALVEALAVGGNGNPLLLEQATLATIEAALDDPGLLPLTLQTAIRARIATLPATAREILFAAAVLGQQFAYRALALITEATLDEPGSLDAALRELTHRRLVMRWRDGAEVTYRFTHSLIQEVAFGAIATPRRQQLEARMADWLLTEGALQRRGASGVIGELDRLISQVPVATPTPLQGAALDALIADPTLPFPVDLLADGDARRDETLARIVLADLPAEQRASLVLCLQHGYTYAQAGEMLGLSRETVRDYLLGARQMFKRLADARRLATADGSVERMR
jgi:DNA-directed RNA polymerase specialized sigma24 family protein